MYSVDPGVKVSKFIIDRTGLAEAVFIGGLFHDCFYYSDSVLKEVKNKSEFEQFNILRHENPAFSREKAESISFSDRSNRVKYACEEFCKIAEKTGKKYLSKLVREGFLNLHELTPQEAKTLVLQKQGQTDFNLFDNNCEWCKCNTAVLHDHHYPTPKSKGGVEVVSICPNCHYEFHFVEKTKFYKATETFLDLMEKN